VVVEGVRESTAWRTMLQG